MGQHIKFHLPGLRKRLDDRGEYPEMPIRTIDSLNKKIWGIQRGKFYVVAARTSNCKSAFVLQIAADIAGQGHPVLYLSLEMDTLSLLERMFSQVCKVPNTDLLHGKIRDYEKDWKEFTEVSEKFEIVITDSIGKTWIEIEEHINKLAEKPKVIIIDHIHEIKKSDSKEREMIDEYVRRFKEMSIRHNFAAIICAQINRTSQTESKDKRPFLHQIKSSGYLEEAADFGILLHWPYQLRLNRDMNKLDLFVDKNRGGRTGHIPLHYEPSTYTFKDAPEENQTDRK